MPRPRFPQFADGEKAMRETARRLAASAQFKSFVAEAIAREREALERSRMLLKLPLDPLEHARRAAGTPAASPPSRIKPKKKR